MNLGLVNALRRPWANLVRLVRAGGYVVHPFWVQASVFHVRGSHNIALLGAEYSPSFFSDPVRPPPTSPRAGTEVDL